MADSLVRGGEAEATADGLTIVVSQIFGVEPVRTSTGMTAGRAIFAWLR
jgi:hypothetical protein